MTHSNTITEFNANEVIRWLGYLMEQSKRADCCRLPLIRQALAALYAELLPLPDAPCEGYRPLSMPLTTQSLITLLDIDLYLSAADDEHANSEACAAACDVAAELEKRGEAGDSEAKKAFDKYCEEVVSGVVII